MNMAGENRRETFNSFETVLCLVENGLLARRALMDLNKEELQDKHLRLMEENMASTISSLIPYLIL